MTSQSNSPRADKREDRDTAANAKSAGLEVNDIAEFLRIMRPDGPWVLSAIVPDGRISTTTFRADQTELLKKWVTARNGAENLYFQVNSSGDAILHKKASKDDIIRAEWLHVDLDGDRKKAWADLQTFQPQPNVILDSGGGYQAFWRITSTADLEDVEAMNKWLAQELGGDNCHDISRIMRLPFTLNLPNKKKRKADRVPVVAQLLYVDDGLTETEPLGRITTAAPASAQIIAVTDEPLDFDASNIGDVANENAQQRALNPERFAGENGSRNENAFALLQSLLGQELEPSLILGIVLCRGLAVSDFFYNESGGKPRLDPLAFAQQQLANARVKLEERAAHEPQWDLTNKAGMPVRSYNNTREALSRLGLDIWHDVFAARDMIQGQPIQDFAGAVSDRALALVRDMVMARWRFDPGKEHLRDATVSLALANRRDPVVDMLDGLQWDGEPRLARWLTQTYGAEDTPYTRAVGELWLRAMCRRAREPGIKYDHMIILEGAQGTGKSLSLAILAGERFSDAALFSKANDRDRAELLLGNWINEVAELEGFTKRDVTDVKQFVTTQIDEYRPAYAHRKERYPRRGVLVGTTNERNWNRDPTGARRFLPIWCEKINLEWLRANREQLLAEADARPDDPLVLPQKVWAEAANVQAARRAWHSYDDFLAEMAPEARFAGWERASTAYIIDNVLDLPRSVLVQPNATKVLAERMNMLGWEGPKVVTLDGGRKARGYRRQTDKPDLREPPF